MVVHARAASASASAGAPPWATHLWSADIASYLADGARIPDPLLPPPPRETLAQKRARWVREFLLVDPVGDAAMGDAHVLAADRASRGAATPAPTEPRRARSRRTPATEGAA
jgi:hypothetical protein